MNESDLFSFSFSFFLTLFNFHIIYIYFATWDPHRRAGHDVGPRRSFVRHVQSSSGTYSIIVLFRTLSAGSRTSPGAFRLVTQSARVSHAGGRKVIESSSLTEEIAVLSTTSFPPTTRSWAVCTCWSVEFVEQFIRGCAISLVNGSTSAWPLHHLLSLF